MTVEIETQAAVCPQNELGPFSLVCLFRAAVLVFSNLSRQRGKTTENIFTLFVLHQFVGFHLV